MNEFNLLERYVIFAGRFQPFHNGHYSVLLQAARDLRRNELLLVAVMTSVGCGQSPDGAFSVKAEEHHGRNRNPWSVATRLVVLSTVTNMLRDEAPGKSVAILAMPRVDIAWDLVTQWLPGRRTWVVPLAGEDFDESKVSFFKERGDHVRRYTDTSGVSGRELRAYFEAGDRSAFEAGVPVSLARIYMP
jgi:hypothetical protein